MVANPTTAEERAQMLQEIKALRAEHPAATHVSPLPTERLIAQVDDLEGELGLIKPAYENSSKQANEALIENVKLQADVKVLTEQLGIAARGYHMNAGHSGLLEGCEILRCLSFTHFLEAS